MIHSKFRGDYGVGEGGGCGESGYGGGYGGEEDDRGVEGGGCGEGGGGNVPLLNWGSTGGRKKVLIRVST